MRFRRTAVPVTERAAAGVLCLVPCYFRSPLGHFCLCHVLEWGGGVAYGPRGVRALHGW